MPGRIPISKRVIFTIRVQIQTQRVADVAKIRVFLQESCSFCVIVPRLEVVQPRLLIEHIAAVAIWVVDVARDTCHRDFVALLI